MRGTYSLEEAQKMSPVGAARYVVDGWYYEVVFDEQTKQGEWTVRPGPTLAKSLGNDYISWESTFFTSLEECKLQIKKQEVDDAKPVQFDAGWKPLDVLHFKMHDL
jgi:hypothetical protein